MSKIIVICAVLAAPMLDSQVCPAAELELLPECEAEPSQLASAPLDEAEVYVDEYCCDESASTDCCACPCFGTPYQTIFVFGGPFTYNSMGDTARYDADYDGNHALGLGCQCFQYEACQFQLGWEIGVAARFGDDDESAEFWCGPVLRYDGLVLANRLKIAPGVTGGLSVVTASMGGERRREEGRGGDATLLFYVGPELAFSTTAHPNLELVYRVHHRSGSDGTLGNMRDGYNANVIGLRHRY